MYKDFKVAVIGDYMTDNWWEAKDGVGLCPSFPAPDFKNKVLVSSNPGGAGNVVEQLAILGASVDGYYPIIQYSNTHKKHYYMHQDTVIFRVSEHCHVDRPIALSVANNLVDKITDYNAVIFADYNKGCLTPESIKIVVDACLDNGIPFFVDAKFDNWNCYRNAAILKCNKEEWEMQFHKLEMGDKQYTMQYKNLVITYGSQGIKILKEDGQWNVPARGGQVVDPNGAGDTFTAVMVAEYWRTEGDILKACHVANIAGGIAVRHKRIYNVTVEDLRKEEAWDE